MYNYVLLTIIFLFIIVHKNSNTINYNKLFTIFIYYIIKEMICNFFIIKLIIIYFQDRYMSATQHAQIFFHLKGRCP
jgi:hypothetical protein